MLFKDQGLYLEARPLLEHALAIREKALGLEHPDTATSLNDLALLLRIEGRYQEAQPLLERALAIYEKILGRQNPETARALNNLGVVICNQGHYEEAQRLYRRAIEIEETVQGPDRPETEATLRNLATLLLEQRRYEEALPLIERVLRNPLAHLDRELPTMPEAERFRLLAVYGRPYRLPSDVSRLDEEPGAGVFALCQEWKGKATRFQVAGLKLAHEKHSRNVQDRIEEIQELGKRLSTLVFLPLEKRRKNHEERVAALRRKRIGLEGSLNAALGLDEVLTTPTVAEVQAALPADAVLLDFYAGKEVFAWAVHREGAPVLVRLGEAEVLRKAQEEFLNQTAVRGAAPLRREDSKPGEELRALFWEPVAGLVGGARTVLVSPDRFLGEMPFGILPDGEGRFLIEKHRFGYLSDATRIVEADGPSADREGSVLAVGDVNYYQRKEARFGPALALAASHSRSRIGDTWPSLEATREELRSLRDLHDLVLGWTSPFDQLDRQGATEEAVRAALPGHRDLHLATHGFFEPESLPSLVANAEKQTGGTLGEERRAVGLLPGLLSGLVLAGVNGQPDPDRDDGYLSAEEIQYLDLSACDLAVLSACETALGSPRAGEGLQSLRRGFAVAGAKTVLSSLWKVDDRAGATPGPPPGAPSS
ncbi:MAG: CHAT domain-containing protein [Planctomycetota bacterium]